ncbi:MAG: glycosyltransferase [Pseudomonadota bacterium]
MTDNLQQRIRAVAQDYRFEDFAHRPSFAEKWGPRTLFAIALYIAVCFMALNLVPNTIWDPSVAHITYVIGILGIWRYGWWFNHTIRASIYGNVTYPRMRARASEIWDGGWRPEQLHFMMTTFREHRDITERVIRGICDQVREAGVPGTIWLGSGDLYDEKLIEQHLRLIASDLDITLRIVRQNQPGKRIAISLILRAMVRAGMPDDALVIFMDGDFVIEPGAVRKCLPLFELYPDLEALTTDEEVICIGPKWMQRWLTMRFAQRRIAMQSHSMSHRVLTLTGRMSVFRARHVKSYEFIRLLEADYLEHWLWGSFRFLSGDDKSTWYYLLKHEARMLYVPDANGYTIEVIEGSAFKRMVENFRRWSGNMLRNGARAIKLGPRKMPFFIWWCLIDQRVAIWTMLVSPTLCIAATLLSDSTYLISYIVYIAVTRLLLSFCLWLYAREVDLNYVWILYLNQITNAVVKIYALWRLSKQKWANRGNQKAGFSDGGLVEVARNTMAQYLTTLSAAMLVLGTIIYARLLETPDWNFISVFVFGSGS